MWCALGQLLTTYPLVKKDDFHWYDFYDRLNRNMLTARPDWLADLRTPKPLETRFWSKNEKDIDTWITNPEDSEFVVELGIAAGNPKAIVVDGHHATQARWFRSYVSVSSALVEPLTARALIRALQTANHHSHFRIPPEEHELEIAEAPYRLIGWLKERNDRESAIDERDPIRNQVHELAAWPGDSALKELDLEVQGQSGTWQNKRGERVFWSENWSDRRDRSDDDPYYDDSIGSNGQRLWVSKKSLKRFLEQRRMDLIIQVQNDRQNQGDGYGYHGRSKEAGQSFHRLYLLKADGTVETATGSIGTW